MTKIAIVLDGDYVYPIYRKNGRYHIDFGGAHGLSDALTFENDVKAICWLRKRVESGIWGKVGGSHVLSHV